MARLSTDVPLRPSDLPQAVAAADAASAGWASWWRAAAELTKPRITKLVTITAGVGFLLSALLRGWDGAMVLVLAAVGCLVGTTLSAAGANALNQWLERDRDARMKRTAGRPLPEGRLAPGSALAVGVGCGAAGVLVLWATAGAAPALVSLVTILLYLLVYTPLKPVTPLSTIVGAVPGALPPVIGWTAAAAVSGDASAGLLEAGGWSLFVLMFVWQIPHFLAIAWMYRDDYARGGYRMLPLTDPDGRATFATILIWSTLLLPATVLPAMVAGPGAAGGPGVLWLYATVAAVTGAAFLGAAWRLAATRTGRPAETGEDRTAARRVFVWSIIHLPVLLVVLVADALIVAW